MKKILCQAFWIAFLGVVIGACDYTDDRYHTVPTADGGIEVVDEATNTGVESGLKDLGEPCTSGAECVSDLCVDDVCALLIEK